MKCPTPSRFACHPSSEGNEELNVSCTKYDYFSPSDEGSPKVGVGKSVFGIKMVCLWSVKCPTPSRFACHPSSEGNEELNVSCIRYDYYSLQTRGRRRAGWERP